ncbi:MAG: repeat-containing protein [Thermoleophilia bacterium]|nr:repeat-containing protein [Thermoleophilia bacterium]
MRTPLRLVTVLVLAITCLVLAAGSASAATQTETATRGTVTATFTFEQPEQYQATDLHLRVDRAGVTVLDGPVAIKDCEQPYCWPNGLYSGSKVELPALRVIDLDGDHEPEVLISVFTGGAHCCTKLRLYRFVNGTYRAVDRDFGNVTARLVDLDHNGVVEFLSTDDRFNYQFTSYAASFAPIQVLDFRAGRYLDVSKHFPLLLRRDAKVALAYIRQQCKPGTEDGDTLGEWAAWTADQYRLGARTAALGTLRREQAKGCIMGDDHVATYVTRLDRFLLSLPGYR